MVLGSRLLGVGALVFPTVAEEPRRDVGEGPLLVAVPCWGVRGPHCLYPQLLNLEG